VLDQVRDGRTKVLFVDAAHFVLAHFLVFMLIFNRLYIKSPAGRKRFNVFGALDEIMHELVTITNDAYINAQSAGNSDLFITHAGPA